MSRERCREICRVGCIIERPCRVTADRHHRWRIRLASGSKQAARATPRARSACFVPQSAKQKNTSVVFSVGQLGPLLSIRYARRSIWRSFRSFLCLVVLGRGDFKDNEALLCPVVLGLPVFKDVGSGPDGIG